MPSGDPIEYITPARIIVENYSAVPVVVYLMLFETSNVEAVEYVMLFDNAAPPIPNAQPEVTIKMFANGFAYYQPANGYRLFQTGLSVGISTSGVNWVAETVPYLIYMLEGREP